MYTKEEIKEMSAKDIAEKFLGISIQRGQYPGKICGYSANNIVLGTTNGWPLPAHTYCSNTILNNNYTHGWYISKENVIEECYNSQPKDNFDLKLAIKNKNLTSFFRSNEEAKTVLEKATNHLCSSGIDTKLGFKLKYDSGSYSCYCILCGECPLCERNLSKLKSYLPELLLSELKVGDKVKIIKPNDLETVNYANSWVSQMDTLDNTNTTITGITGIGSVQVKGTIWNFDVRWLEKIEEVEESKTTSPYKPGDYLVYNGFCKNIFIFRGINGGVVKRYANYFDGTLLYEDVGAVCNGSDMKEKVRFATIDEVNLLNSKLEAEGKVFNPDTLQIEDCSVTHLEKIEGVTLIENPYITTRTKMQKIYEVACEEWKGIIQEIISRFSDPFSEDVMLSIKIVEEMDKAACTPVQKDVLKEVFPKFYLTTDEVDTNATKSVYNVERVEDALKIVSEELFGDDHALQIRKCYGTPLHNRALFISSSLVPKLETTMYGSNVLSFTKK